MLLIVALLIHSKLVSSSTIAPMTNAFENGCLVAIAKRRGEEDKRTNFMSRVCNSDDALLPYKNTSCLPPIFETYFEVRIASGDWFECKSFFVVQTWFRLVQTTISSCLSA